MPSALPSRSSSSRRPPPKNIAMRASMVMAAAMVAAMELIRMSAVLHVSEFVRQDAFQFAVVQEVQQPAVTPPPRRARGSGPWRRRWASLRESATAWASGRLIRCGRLCTSG